MLGLARKAGKLGSGEFQTEKNVKERRAFLTIIAEDASDNTKKKFYHMCDHYHIPVRTAFTMDMLGKATGTQMRSSVCVTDEGFAGAILKLMDPPGMPVDHQ